MTRILTVSVAVTVILAAFIYQGLLSFPLIVASSFAIVLTAEGEK